MARVSRRKLAMYAAERLLAGDDNVIEELAALIVSEKRERELDLLVRDIEVELAERGTIVATVESAHKLDDDTKRAIERMLASAEGRSAARASSSDARSEACRPEADGSSRDASSDDSRRGAETDDSSRDVKVLLRESIDKTLIGGFKLRTPTGSLDATMSKKLHDLRAGKI